LFLSLVIITELMIGWKAVAAVDSPLTVAAEDKARIIVMTGGGGDLDDRQLLVRFWLFVQPNYHTGPRGCW
jgi:hypothetical protein